MPRISKGLKQAYEAQDFVFAALMALKAGLTKEDGSLKIAREEAQALAALTKSWQLTQEQIRIHRNRPMPGSLRPPTAREKREQERERLRRRRPLPEPLPAPPECEHFGGDGPAWQEGKPPEPPVAPVEKSSLPSAPPPKNDVRKPRMWDGQPVLTEEEYRRLGQTHATPAPPAIAATTGGAVPNRPQLPPAGSDGRKTKVVWDMGRVSTAPVPGVSPKPRPMTQAEFIAKYGVRQPPVPGRPVLPRQ
jgi:hypothetical protein